MKFSFKHFISRVPWIVIGAFLCSVGVNGFFVPHQLLMGGISGIALILLYFLNLPLSITVLVLNIPGIILALTKANLEFALLTVCGIVFNSFFFWLTAGWDIAIQSPMVSAIFGGLIVGIGAGLALWKDGSLGGLDALFLVISKYITIPVGMVMLGVNCVLMIILGILTNIETALLTIIGLFVSSNAIDMIRSGLNKRITVFIISENWETISNKILQGLGKGLTLLKGEGAFTSKEKVLAYCVIRSLELEKLKAIVIAEDKDAFISAIDTREVHGGLGIGRRF